MHLHSCSSTYNVWPELVIRHIIMSLVCARYDLNKNALQIIRMNFSCKEAVAVKRQYLTTLVSSSMCSVSPAAHMIKHMYR